MVITDWQALYDEFIDTGTAPGEDRGPPDDEVDYLQLVARLYAYAQAHQGIVADLAHEIRRSRGYAMDYGSLIYAGTQASSNRHRMAELIDELISRTSVGTSHSLEYIALVGDDQVVPFYRVEDPQAPHNLSDEHLYPSELSGTMGNPALIDTGNSYILSDLPYGTRDKTTPAYEPRPWPKIGVGRIFASHPYRLIHAIDVYEQELYLGRLPDRVSLFYSATAPGDDVDFERVLERPITNTMLHAMSDWYGPTLDVYSGAELAWTKADVQTRLRQDYFDSIWAHATHMVIGPYTGSQWRKIQANDLRDEDTGPTMLVGVGCHMGYTTGNYPNRTRASYYHDALMLPLIERGITVYAPSSEAYVAPGDSPEAPLPANLNELLAVALLDGLTDRTIETVGEAWKHVFDLYHKADPYWLNDHGRAGDRQRARHTAVSYGNVLYGLPTQPLDRGGILDTFRTELVSQERNSPAPSTHLPFTVVVPELVRHTDSRGEDHYRFRQGGATTFPSDGPPLPLIARSFLLPRGSTVVGVTHTSTSTLRTDQDVTLANVKVWSTNGRRKAGSYELPSPYPSALYWWDATEDADGVRLWISVVPMRYNPAQRQAELYDQLGFDVEYRALSASESGSTIDGLWLNDSQPVCRYKEAVSLVVSVGSDDAATPSLGWTVRDPAGLVVVSEKTPIEIEQGTTHITYTVNTGEWPVGPLNLAVGLWDEETLLDSENLSSAVQRTCLLEQPVRAHRYWPDQQALWEIEVRDENGVQVRDLDDRFYVKVDGQTVSAQVEETAPGHYVIRFSLSGLSLGTHAARIGVIDAHGMDTWREWSLTVLGNHIYLPLTVRD
jgi:hypothetical protein